MGTMKQGEDTEKRNDFSTLQVSGKIRVKSRTQTNVMSTCKPSASWRGNHEKP